MFKGEKFPDIDWWCDDCNASLNQQPGFNDRAGTWKCTECSCVNEISSDAIIDFDDNDNLSGESLSVDDAALIWQSNGFDEDYTFGYTDSELRKALRN